MATATTSSTDPAQSTVGKVPSDKDEKSSHKDVELDDTVFKFGPAHIQTPEDAAMAYLREEITEDEFRTACGKFGVLPGTLLYTKVGNDRPDAPFKRNIPDDIYDPSKDPDVSLEDRLKAVEERDKAREKATKEAEENEKDVQPVKIVQG